MMEKGLALRAILWISLVGMLFSGYLSYSELFLGVCAIGKGCSLLFGIPSCVYGFLMYLVVFVIALLGSKNQP